MIADRRDRRSARLLVIAADGAMRHLPRAALGALFAPGDLVIANDAATLPASLTGQVASGAAIEIRLAAWVAIGDPSRFDAIAFGSGDHRTRTEDRPPPPLLRPDDRLALGPLRAIVERVSHGGRKLRLRLRGDRAEIFRGLARHGRPIQYAHVTEPLTLSDLWTSFAADPVAFEPPSAGFALDWQMTSHWRARGIGFAALTHAAGISSTGDAALDARLPFDEPYRISEPTAAAIAAAKARGARVVAVGTSVVRALEAAASGGGVRAGAGVATGRIGRETALRVADMILTGVHQPGDSHFELLRAFAGDALLERIAAELAAHHYRAHEFGDSILLARAR